MQLLGPRARVLATTLGALLVMITARPAAADSGGFALLLLFDDPPPGGASGAAAPGMEPTPELAAWAGPATPANLPALLSAAITAAPNLQLAKIDIAIAEARMLEAAGVDDWRLGGQLVARRSTGTILGVTNKETAVGLSGSISRALSTGGSIGLSASTGFNDSENGFSDPGREWTDTVTLDLTQPLLRGRGRSIARANIARAALSRDAAVLSQRQTAIAAVQTIVASYWQLALAERQLAIRRSGLDLIRERRRLTEAGINGGKVAPSELLAVEQAVATQMEQILNAEVAVVQQSIAVRRAAGLPIEPGAIALASGADASAPARTTTLEAALRRAIETSPELASLSVQDKDATIAVEIAENGLLPRLDAALSLGPSGRDTRPSDAARNLVKFDEFSISGSLTFEYDLGHRTASGQTRAARLQRERIQVNAADIRAQLAQSVAQEVAVLELAARRVGLAQTAIDLARKNIEVEQARFSLGKSTNFDVLQRQNELQQAELSKAQAEIDARQAEAALAALTGDLLDEYGISLDETRARR